MPEFRTLVAVLSNVEASPQAAPEPAVIFDPTAATVPEAIDIALSDARLMRAHLRETLEESFDDLLRDIASDVVGRELQLQPVEIKQIIVAAIDRYRAEMPLRTRVHPDDVAALRDLAIDVVPDGALKRGDAFLELRDGAVDLSLGIRLERLLEARA